MMIRNVCYPFFSALRYISAEHSIVLDLATARPGPGTPRAGFASCDSDEYQCRWYSAAVTSTGPAVTSTGPASRAGPSTGPAYRAEYRAGLAAGFASCDSDEYQCRRGAAAAQLPVTEHLECVYMFYDWHMTVIYLSYDNLSRI